MWNWFLCIIEKIEFLLKDQGSDILMNIFLSIITSYFFWFLTFRFTRTSIKFSSKIQKIKSKGGNPNIFRYRIKLINTGARNLVEISAIVKLSIKLNDESLHYTYIRLGGHNIMPVLWGKKYQYKHNNDKEPKQKWPHLLAISLTDAAVCAYNKSIYTDNIQNKAREKSLCINDIIYEYKEDIRITLFLYGNDEVTGARKMFVKSYGYDDIKQGHFREFTLPKNRIKYIKHVNDCLILDENDKEAMDVLISKTPMEITEEDDVIIINP